MSLKSSIFIATNLDGFIARAGGELDWLDASNTTVPKGEDCGYNRFIESIDILVMGRKTYDQVSSFDKWPYRSKPVIVLSRNKIEISNKLTKTVSHSSETPKELHELLSKEGAI